MDFHGAAMNRTWVKLGATAKKGEAAVTCAEAVEGWRPGDRVIITSTQTGDEVVGSRPRSRLHRGTVHSFHRRDGHHPGSAAGLRARGDRRLPRRGRQPEPQRGRRIGRPGPVARPHDVSPRLGRVHQLRGVSPLRQRGRPGPLRPALPPVRRHHARQFRGRRVDLGQRQPLADHPRYELSGGARLRRLPERRPRLLPRRRDRGLQRPRPQPGRPGVSRPAAAASGAALRRERAGPGSGGPTAATSLPATSPAKTTVTDFASRPRRPAP